MRIFISVVMIDGGKESKKAYSFSHLNCKHSILFNPKQARHIHRRAQAYAKFKKGGGA